MVLDFFFNDTAPTEIYTLSLHDALPISLGSLHRRQQRYRPCRQPEAGCKCNCRRWRPDRVRRISSGARSEEHTSELQSRGHLVCRLLLEKKKSLEYVIELPRNVEQEGSH